MSSLKYVIFDRAQGGLIDTAAVTASTVYLRLNLDGTITPASGPNDPLALVFDPVQFRRVCLRQLVGGAALDVVVTPPSRTRNPDNITWEAPVEITLADLKAGKYNAVSDGKGGYIITGHNWRSNTFNVPACRIKSSLAGILVTFRLCNFFGYGVQSDGKARGMIHGEYHNALAFEECIGFSGKPPPGWAGAFPGKFLDADTPCFISFKHCESYKTGGIRIHHFWNQAQSGRTDPHPIYVGQMAQYDVDGRMVNADGNWRTGHLAQYDFDPAGFLVHQEILALGNCLAEDFKMINDPESGAMWEDGNSWYSSGATAAAPYVLRRFLIEGGLVYDETFTGVEAVHGRINGEKKAYSGTGSNAGDAIEPHDDQGNLLAPHTADSVPNNLQFIDGTILTYSQAGIGISAGNRHLFDRVKVLNVGAFRSRNPRGFTVIQGPHCALTVWDQAWRYNSSYTPGDKAFFFGSIERDCVFGDFNLNPDTLAFSNGGIPGTVGGPMTYVPGTVHLAGLTTINRTMLPIPNSVADALNLLDSYRAAQLKVWADAGITVGCTT